MASAVDVGKFDYSSSSISSRISSSSSSSSSCSRANIPTPERQRGPSHHAPAAYFFSEGGVTPGSHTAVYAHDAGPGRRADAHPATAENVMDWSPSSSVSAVTSPRVRGVGGRDVDDDDELAAVAPHNKAPMTSALDGASLSSASRSRSSSPQLPSSRLSSHPRSSTASTGPARAQFTLPTLHRQRSESETSAATTSAAAALAHDAASPRASADPTATSLAPHRLSTTRSFDRDTSAEAQDPPSPLPTALAIPSSARAAEDTAAPSARVPPQEAVPGPHRDTSEAGGVLATSAGARRAVRRRSPGHAASHSPHKRPLPAVPGPLPSAHSRPSADPLREGTSLSPSTPRRSPSAAHGHTVSCYSDDDTEREDAAARSPPPKMHPAERRAVQGSRRSRSTPVHSDEVAAAFEDAARARAAATASVALPERPSRLSPSRDSSEALMAADADGEGVVHSPATQPIADTATARRLPPREAAASTSPLSIRASSSSHMAGATSTTRARPLNRPPTVRSPSDSPIATETAPVAEPEAHFERAKRRLQLHTVSADRGRTPSVHRSRRNSLEAASLAGSSVGGDVPHRTRRQRSTISEEEEEESEDDMAAAAVPLLLSILGGTAEHEAASMNGLTSRAPDGTGTHRTLAHGLSGSASRPATSTTPTTTPTGTAAGRGLPRAIPFKAAPASLTEESRRRHRDAGMRPPSADAAPSTHPPPPPTPSLSASSALHGSWPQRSGLGQRVSAFRSAAIRRRGVPTEPDQPDDGASVATSVLAMSVPPPLPASPAAASFDLQFIPYVRTRASPVRAQAAASASVAETVPTAGAIVMAHRGPRHGAMSDSATSPIAAAPSSMWSSFHAGTFSPPPRTPRAAVPPGPTLVGTPEGARQPVSVASSPQLVSAHVLSPPPDPREARVWDAIEANQHATRQLAQRRLLHAEVCDREKVSLLESHFRRSLQTEWCYYLTVDRLLQTHAASQSPPPPVALRPGPRSPTPRPLFSAAADQSPSRHRSSMGTATSPTTALERIMGEQTALADELQYLSGALADLMEQHV